MRIESKMTILAETYRGIPTASSGLVVGILPARWQEVATFGDVFLPFLPTNLDLLFFSTTPKVILPERAFGLVRCWAR